MHARRFAFFCKESSSVSTMMSDMDTDGELAVLCQTALTEIFEWCQKLG